MASRGDVDADTRSIIGETPLYKAAQNGHLEVVQYLASRGDVDADALSFSLTPLHIAAWYGHLDVVKYLLSRDDVDGDGNAQESSTGETPLIMMMRHGGNLDVVKYLLSRDDVDVNAQNKWGETALDKAVGRGNYAILETIELLRARGGVCLARTDEACGLVMRPFHFILTVGANHSGAVHTVTATDPLRPNAATIYSLVHSGGFSLTVDSETGMLSLPADFGVLTAGLVATASIQAATEGGTQKVTVERVVKVLPLVTAELSDYPSRLTAAAGYMGVLATLSGTEEGVTVSYRPGLDEEVFTLAVLPSGKAALSLVSRLGGEDVTATAVVALGKDGYLPATVTALVTVSALLPAKTLVTVFPDVADIVVTLSARRGGTRYEKISGSVELSVLDSGEISVTAPRLSSFAWYHLDVRADSPGVLGGERFLVSLLAAPCAPGAPPAGDLIQAVDRNVEIDDICRMILSGADVSLKNSKNGTPLHRALVGEYYAAASLLIAAGAEVDAQNSRGKTPLYLATSISDNRGIASLLLMSGANPTISDRGGVTPFDNALARNDYDLIVLLAENMDPLPDGARFASGEKVLRQMVRTGYFDSAITVAPLLASRGVDVNALNSNGNSPLYLAANVASPSMVSLFLSLGANVSLSGGGGDTPLHRASYHGGNSAAALTIAFQLLTAGANVTVVNGAGRTPFFYPLWRNCCIQRFRPNNYAMIALLAEYADVLPAVDHAEARNVLRSAAISGSDSPGALAAVSLLASLSVNVDAPGHGGKTPIYLAIEAGDAAMVSMFVNVGADLSVKDNDGLAPLHFSMARDLSPGDPTIVSMLANAPGGNVNIRTEDDGSVALHFSAFASPDPVNIIIVSILLDAGADVNVRRHISDDLRDAGETPLIVALAWTSLLKVTMVSMLANAPGVKLDAPASYRNERAPLHVAALGGSSLGNSKMHVSILLDAGANVNVKDGVNGQTPLHLVVIEGNVDFLSRTVNPGDPKMVSILLDAGANVDAEDNNGRTPLHEAVIRANDGGDAAVAVISALVDAGANVNAEDNDGQTPLDYETENNTEIINLLTE